MPGLWYSRTNHHSGAPRWLGNLASQVTSKRVAEEAVVDVVGDSGGSWSRLMVVIMVVVMVVVWGG